jgi:prepilin-type processing-associated H-X9-DG protein
VPLTLHNYGVNYGNTGFTDTNAVNTVAVVGTTRFLGAPFEKGKSIPFLNLTDGLSNTMLASELVQGRMMTRDDLRGMIWWGVYSGFTSYNLPNATAPDTMYTTSLCDPTPPNPPCIVPGTASYPYMQASRSRHPGGVNTLFGDGSVRFIQNSIRLQAWRDLSTSQDGNVVSDS